MHVRYDPTPREAFLLFLTSRIEQLKLHHASGGIPKKIKPTFVLYRPIRTKNFIDHGPLDVLSLANDMFSIPNKDDL